MEPAETPRNKKVSCIICAYNERSTISGVLSVLSEVPAIDEVIVVDDGSSDGTQEVLRTAGDHVTVVTHAKNRGKTAALVSGFKKATGEYILLLDADLIGLTPAHVTALLSPVLTGVADVTISIRENSLLAYRAIGLDFVSGERVFPRALIADRIHEMEKLPPYGFESYVNEIFIAHRLRLRCVKFRGVLNNRKYNKLGIVRGFFAEVGMIIDVFQVLTPWRAARQIMRLLDLKQRSYSIAAVRSSLLRSTSLAYSRIRRQ